jgi:NitT/TauT family transport system permease protein
MLMATSGAVPGLPQLADDAESERYFSARRRERLRSQILPAIGIVGMVLAWWSIVAGFHVRPFIAPSPALVARTIFSNYRVLFDNLVPTAVEAGGGFLIGNLAAIAVAAVFVHSRTLQQIFFPVAVMFNSMPVVAKAPILVLIMGSGLAPKITIAALVCFFPTLVNMVKGLESVNPQVMELMSVLSASKAQIFFKLRLFNSLPYLFSALRIAASMSVIGAVVGEWIGATRGIGALILQATYAFDTGLLYAAILLSACLAGAFFLVVAYFEWLVVVWPAEGSR